MEATPPVVHRALSGRRDRGRRHPARRLYDGRAPGSQPERAALRPARSSQDAPPDRGRRPWHRRLWQLRRRAHGGRRGQFPPRVRRQHPGQRDDRGHRRYRQDLLFGRLGDRQSDRLCRLENRARWHSRRNDGFGRLLRGFGGKAPHRPGRRSVYREAADRGVPRADVVRRDRRDPGHGCRRPHLLFG